MTGKISEDPDLGTVVGTELIPVVSAGANKRSTPAQIAAYIASLVQTLTNKTLTSPAITSPTGIVKGDVGLGNVPNVNPTDGSSTFTGLKSTGTILLGVAQSNLGSAVNIGSSGTAGSAMLDIDNTDSGSGSQTSVYIRRNTSSVVGSIATTNTGASFNPTSDERLKDFIGIYDPQKAIAIIRADPARDYNWKLDGSYAIGWGAQTSYAVSPDLAHPGDDNPDLGQGDEGFLPWGVDPAKRTPYLWAAVTFLLDRNDDLEKRIVALESRRT